MNEAEWRTCAAPEDMLGFLKGKGSRRKLRLFACACCHRISALLADEVRQALDVAERVAEGEVSGADRKAARAAAFGAGWAKESVQWDVPVSTRHARGPAKASVCDALARRPIVAAMEAAKRSTRAAVQFDANRLTAIASLVPLHERWTAEWDASRRESERVALACLIRDIFGNPFLPVPAIDAAWLEAHGGSVAKFAADLYEWRAFERMPELADAMERAGCADGDILAHCRSGGAHVRGCWVVDLLPGKA